MSVLLHIVDDECFADAVTNIAEVKPGGVFVAIDPVVTHAFWGRGVTQADNWRPRSLTLWRTELERNGLKLVSLAPVTVLLANVVDTRRRVSSVGLDLYWRLFVKLMLLSGVAERVSAHAAAAADRMALRVLTHGPSTKCLVARKLPV